MGFSSTLHCNGMETKLSLVDLSHFNHSNDNLYSNHYKKAFRQNPSFYYFKKCISTFDLFSFLTQSKIQQRTETIVTLMWSTWSSHLYNINMPCLQSFSVCNISTLACTLSLCVCQQRGSAGETHLSRADDSFAVWTDLKRWCWILNCCTILP